MRIPAAVLSAVAAEILTALALACLGSNGLGGCHGWIHLFSLGVGLSVGVAAWLTVPASPSREPRSCWDWLMIGVFCIASARAFFWLLYSDEDDWKILSPNNLGDLALHISFIHWLVAAPHWWPASPILAGDPLRYPLGSDLFNALLLQSGIPLVNGLLWTALGGAILTGVALWRWGGAVAFAAILFNGGLAGLVLFKGGDPDVASEWKNLFLTLFVTQRGFLFSLPAGLLLLTAWREETFGAGRKKVLPLAVQSLLLGTTPIFSVHTALFLGIAMMGLALLAPSSRERMVRLALFSWPVMAFFGWLVTTGGGGRSALHAIGWCPGWMTDGTVGFWFWNFGLSLPLGIFLCLELLRRGADTEARAFVWPAACLFVACLFFRFAPWPWDNMKLMIWSWLVVAPYLWSVLLQGRPLLIRVLALMFLFGSGAATLAAGLDGRHGYGLVKRSALDETASLLHNIPPSAVIACAPEYNQPVLMLGHPVVCGYEGHLWSHGLDYKDRLASLESVMRGDVGWQDKARSLGASYVYWGPLELRRWPDSKLPWAKQATPPSLHRVEE